MKKVFIIIQACVRLHNFCIDNRLPILNSGRRTPPPEVAVDNVGRLADDTRRTNVEPSSEWGRVTLGSCLRDRLVKEVADSILVDWPLLG